MLPQDQPWQVWVSPPVALLLPPQALTPLSPPAPPHRYLYLLFSEDNVLSPEDWVFNTEAHPLPVNHSDSSSKAGHHH